MRAGRERRGLVMLGDRRLPNYLAASREDTCTRDVFHRFTGGPLKEPRKSKLRKLINIT